MEQSRRTRKAGGDLADEGPFEGHAASLSDYSVTEYFYSVDE
jgi:hypothetical protein